MDNLKREILILCMEEIREENEKIWCASHGYPCVKRFVDVDTVKKILNKIEGNFVEVELKDREEILETLIIFATVIGEGGYSASETIL